ncbi:MAG: phage/plasmid primase, P4 family [Lentimicrobium sp.]|jgi:putative DNA primase/helicase|nr:phage/plasmid primase, P4 family [Lentimicrobium sp.]
MDIKNIPQELKQNALFCTWRLEPNGKVPYNPVTKMRAKSNNSNTFHPFNTILKYLADYYAIDDKGKPIGGLGLGIFNGYSAIDIDHCVERDGKLSELATDIIDYCHTYTEYSPSGTGVRLIFKTPTIINKETHYINNQNLGLEIYISDNTNKFVTLTGNIIHGYDIAELDITYIVNKYMLKRDVKISALNGYVDTDEVDIKIKNKMRVSAKFREIWNKQAPGDGADESETDMILCNMLADVFDGNYAEIEEAFSNSPYFQSKDDKHKNKWLVRTDYREETIKKAISRYHQNKLEQLAEFELNDTGNAHRLAANFREQIKYNVDNKQWMTYNGKYWQHDVYGQVKNYAEILIEEMKQDAIIAQGDYKKQILGNIKRVMSSGGKEAMIRETQHLKDIPVTNADFDTEPHYFNTPSGVVNLITGEILPHEKHMMLSRYTDIAPEKGTPKLWLKFLTEIFDGNAELIEYIQRVLGYAMTAYTKEQAMFIFLGDGANGKSLLLETFSKIMGTYATTSSVDILVERKQHVANMSEIARLARIRTVVTDETEMGDKLRESGIKSMTSDYGYITARFLYGNEFVFKPEFKIFMATNHRPIIRGTDHGIWRRIKIIPFNRVIPDDKQDRRLGEKLTTEYGKILNWLIDGAIKWYQDGLKEPRMISESVKEYRSEMDLVQKWITDNCETDPSYFESANVLFNNITQYIESNKEFRMSNTLFGRNMSKKFEKVRQSGVTIYKGIRLRTKSFNQRYDEAIPHE